MFHCLYVAPLQARLCFTSYMWRHYRQACLFFTSYMKRHYVHAYVLHPICGATIGLCCPLCMQHNYRPVFHCLFLMPFQGCVLLSICGATLYFTVNMLRNYRSVFSVCMQRNYRYMCVTYMWRSTTQCYTVYMWSHYNSVFDCLYVYCLYVYCLYVDSVLLSVCLTVSVLLNKMLFSGTTIHCK